ncbi:MAG: hypothetical protein AAF825_03990 [Pseudomonadota bacterium]
MLSPELQMAKRIAELDREQEAMQAERQAWRVANARRQARQNALRIAIAVAMLLLTVVLHRAGFYGAAFLTMLLLFFAALAISQIVEPADEGPP